MNTPKPFACLALASALALQGLAKENLFPILTEDILDAPANRVVYEHLAKQAYDALDRREERLGAISTPAQFKEYQEDLKKFFVSKTLESNIVYLRILIMTIIPSETWRLF